MPCKRGFATLTENSVLFCEPQLSRDDDILSSAQIVCQAKGELQRACMDAAVSSAPVSCCVQVHTSAEYCNLTEQHNACAHVIHDKRLR